MKIGCHCGAMIYDSADQLPGKGHLVPDQAWLGLQEEIEAQVIDPLAAGTVASEGAAMRMRRLLNAHARLMWQCRACGRIYVDGLDGELHVYAPEKDDTERQVLRGRA